MEFDQLREHYHLALAEFARGNPGPVIALLSQGNDVSLAGGFGGFTHGYAEVAHNIEFAAAQFREGKISFESLSDVVSGEMGYLVEIECYRSKLGGSEDVTADYLRVTSIFRREGGVWKLVHRHGDPTTAMNALIQLLPRTVVSIRKAA